MKIAVFGSLGMLGSRVASEASRRGHEVSKFDHPNSISKDHEGLIPLDISDTESVVSAINSCDATVIVIPPSRDGGSHEPLLQAHQNIIAAKPSGRVLVGGGGGSLEVNGVRLIDTPDFPTRYIKEATTVANILDMYRGSEGLNWTILSPPMSLAPGVRTGSYKMGIDSPVGDAISAEDFAVAFIDEIENRKHINMRFTVAN
ncbi:NAD(P)-dependent oxidoreductase [Sansalvadorimonas verongulae]|uniref:NAD(P)-dependent oxidoreductase n=1 Tax=Sansalvadorimonas verongulae TaxID=2172824 RepID=UPI0012BD386C|nr:NAD(P)H-binding protein [Sansalvadorimonas verongulae]MTI11951.1 FMN reductase [Sansalvadorimonas verongulae]